MRHIYKTIHNFIQIACIRHVILSKQSINQITVFKVHEHNYVFGLAVDADCDIHELGGVCAVPYRRDAGGH